MFIPSHLSPYTNYLNLLSQMTPSLSFDVPMSRHTSFRVGGPAAITVCPETKEVMLKILRLTKQMHPDLPVCILGNGSNVLFEDDGYHGLVVMTNKLQNVDFSLRDAEDYVNVSVDCGVSLTQLSKQCVAEGRALNGLAFAYGIPGYIGGAIVMNAGAYGGEMSDVVERVEYYDPSVAEIKTARREELCFSYRHSLFTDHPEYVVLSAVLRMKTGDRDIIVNEMAQNMTARQLKQPLNLHNAGSIFKRPEGTFAGKLIEESGLKGFSIGGAQVSEKHAGFIVNLGHATATDILSLIEHIEHVVRVNFGIQLEREIKLISSKSKQR